MAKRDLRKLVIWRKKSYGTKSNRGKKFVEQITTVAQTIRKQIEKEFIFLRAINYEFLKEKRFIPKLPEKSDLGLSKISRLWLSRNSDFSDGLGILRAEIALVELLVVRNEYCAKFEPIIDMLLVWKELGFLLQIVLQNPVNTGSYHYNFAKS